MNRLNHNALTCSAVPIPPWERPLQTVEAQPYFNVSQASLVLEGIVFDRNNNLLFVDVATGRVFKLTPERQLSIVLKENSFGASGLAVHKDGRIFIASVGDMQRGSVRAIEPNGTREQMIVAPDTGFLVNDLVFDNQGGFYFTDSRGNSADPQGGVFYVSPNVGSIHAILPGLAVGNGIAIDPVGSQIWATEHAKNRLHRVRLSDATTVAPFGSVVTYQFTGPAPDGARVDSEGNVYVAISGQGRVMVFNRNGLPIGQIVLPDRDKGRNLKSTSLAIRPGHRELFIVANSGTEPGGAMIFRSDTYKLYGVELLWPLVLVQSSILRNSMGYIQTDKNQLSVMYAFEYLIESALTESERTTSNDIMLTVKYASDSDFNFIEDNIDSRCCYFISLSPEQRKKQLISIVRSFHSLWGKYAREKQDIKMLNEMNNTSWVWPDNINW
ncbi:hypothetical protein KLPMMM109M2_02280 [Klebsiella pneumoniae]